MTNRERLLAELKIREDKDKYLSDLEWALALLMDGVKEHDIVPQCGCTKEEAKRIYEIARVAINNTY